jgi:hypothetical protein
VLALDLAQGHPRGIAGVAVFLVQRLTGGFGFHDPTTFNHDKAQRKQIRWYPGVVSNCAFPDIGITIPGFTPPDLGIPPIPNLLPPIPDLGIDLTLPSVGITIPGFTPPDLGIPPIPNLLPPLPDLGIDLSLPSVGITIPGFTPPDLGLPPIPSLPGPACPLD